MSRKPMSRMCFRIFAGLIILSFGFAIPATAQRTASLPMIPAPPMPTSTLANPYPAPLFLSLLDDVILKKQIETDLSHFKQACELSAPCDGTCGTQCRCNLETITSESELEKACEEADDWAALMTCPCDLKNCGGGCDVLADGQQLACSPLYCDGCNQCNVPTNNANNYCKQIAQLLTASLENSKSSAKEKQEVVEAAMKLVAQKALETADARIVELQLEHAQALHDMELKLVRANSQTDAIQDLQAWIRPIYNNQNRNYQQLRLLTANSSSLHRSVATWEQKMLASMAKVPTQQDSLTWQTPVAPVKPVVQVDSEVTHLKRELAEMAKRIEKLQSNSVKPAGHLEPIYIPDAELQPLMPEMKMLPRYRR